MERDMMGILDYFNYTYPRVCKLYTNGVLSAGDIKELWGIYCETELLAFETILNTSSEEHFMQEVREWFLKHTPYGGGRLFLCEPFDWIMIYSGNDKVIKVRKKVAEGLELPFMDYTVLSFTDVDLNTMNGFDELGRYFLECALNGFYEPIDFALEFAQKNKHVYQERTILLMLKKHFIDGEALAKLEKDIQTMRRYREKVTQGVERLRNEQLVNVGNMWFVLVWYGGRGIIFWEKEKDEVLVSLASWNACGRLINSGKYKQLAEVTFPITVGAFATQYESLARDAFKLLESKWEMLDSTMKMVVMIREL